jgi:hypothetical protein
MPARRARHRDVPLRDLHGKGAKRRIARHPGGFLFGYFLLAAQEKVTRPRCGEPQVTRGRRPLNKKAARKGGFVNKNNKKKISASHV